MAMVSRILNLANTELPDLSATFSNLDVNSLLANATLTREEGNATVTLPISFGDLSLVATINFSDGDTIAFTGATASIAGVNLVITPNEQIEVPEIQTGYNKISTLLDILDNNNNIKFNLKVGSDISALVNFNPKTLSADIILGDVVAKYKDNNIYLNYNDLKVKLSINDIDTVVNKLSPLLDGKLEIPDFNKLLEGIDVMSLIDGAISSLTMVESENKLTLSTVIDAIPVDIRLDIVDGCYSIGGIYLTAQNTNVEITPYKDSINTILDEDLDNYNDILPLLDLIDDYNNVSLAIKIQQTELYFTLNLKTLTAFASVDGLEAFIDFNTGDIYARYPGVKAKVNLNDAQPILNVIEPLIVKFAGNNPLENLDFSCLRNLSIQDVLSSISVTEENEKLYLSVEVNDIKATAKFNTEDKSLIFESADISAFGTTLSAKKSEALNLEFDLTEDYIDLKDLVDTLGEKVCSVLLSNQLSVSASGSITSGNTVITIKDCAIQITDILGAPKANATLVIDIATTADDGTVTVSTHSIRLVYLDPSLVEEGAINVYFTYDNSADENVLEGTFTTTKASETLDILKRIYSLMPELQNALSPIIIPDTNGNPTLPNLNVDLLSLINSIQFSDDTLSADLNGKAFLCSLPSSMQALIQASKDGLILSVPSLKVDCLSLNLALNINKPAENEITDQLFTYQLSGNESDFSSINELLKVLSKTAESRSFDINANIGLSIGDWNIAKDTLHLRAQLDVIEKKTYAVITLTRKAFSVLGMSVWKDYDGTSTLYLDPENQMIYTKVEYRTRKLVWFQYQYTNHVEYAKYTVEEFTSDLLNNILKLVRLSNTIESLITNSNNNSNTSSTSTATIENTLLKYAYNGNDTFALSLDLEPLLKDVQKVDVKITHDSDFNVNSLTATVGLVNVITLNLDATLTSPFNVYQQTKETIASEVASGNYN